MRFGCENDFGGSFGSINCEGGRAGLVAELQRAAVEGVAKGILPSRSFSLGPISLRMPFEPQRTVEAGNSGDAFGESARGFFESGVAIGKNKSSGRIDRRKKADQEKESQKTGINPSVVPGEF